MNCLVLKQLVENQIKKDVTVFKVGDTVRVGVKIRESSKSIDKFRIQFFEGAVIKKIRGGIQESFTVRYVSYGVGVERTYPLNSPNIHEIKVLKRGRVRRAKLYYLRGKIGKAAKIKEILKTAN